jgi:D-amino-acid dehydrogenase
MDRAVRIAHFLKQAGIDHRVYAPDELIAFEPALAPIPSDLVGAVAYPADEVGDARRFCEALVALLQDRGVRFQFSEPVRAVERQGNRITAVITPRGPLRADACVLAAGSYSPLLARQMGFRLPVRPVKGYSITCATDDWQPRPAVPILDDALHACVVPLGSNLRVAGTAELGGYDSSVRPPRIDNLKRLLMRILPSYPLAEASIEGWAGLRPMTPDGKPILGASPIANLFLNTGHGHLGWTMAAGSARLVAALVTGQDPDVDVAPYAWGRAGV